MHGMTVMGSPPSRPALFDPTTVDCFAGSLNMNDREISALIGDVRQQLHAQGEYDQNHAAVLSWDQAMDILTVAELLWRAAKDA